MTTNNFLKIILPLLFCTLTTIAQELSNCGDLKVDLDALKKAKQLETMLRKNARPLATDFLIRVYFHIGNYNDGSNPVTTPQVLQQEFDSLRSDYASNNICFLFAGYDYVNNSNLDTNFNANTDNPNLFDAYRIPSCINIYYVQKIKGSNSACANNCGIGGTSLSIPSTICLISSGNIGAGRTISHEVGHCMGLMHTFSFNNGGRENIDGSNAASAGDHITDTPADPYGFNGMPCFSTTGCIYSGNCQDPNGETNYLPPYSNLMSYWLSVVGRACIRILQLTAGQYDRVRSFLSTDPALESCGSPDPDLLIANFTKSNGYFFWSATNSITTNGNVNLSGTAKCGLGAPTIKLNPGFHANVAAGGRIRISAKICN